MAAPNAEHQHHQQPSPSQTLPSISALTNGLSNGNQYSPQNRQPSHLPSRDSGTWPHPQMKPVEGQINNPSLQVSTLLNPDDSQQKRNSIPSTPTSARLSQPTLNTTLPSINQTFDVGNRGSVDYHPSIDSRRSSIDSRIHTGITNLGLNNPVSPYESQNGSQVSLAASLRRPNHQTPLSPLGGRNSIRASHGPRVAPPIVGVARVPGAPDPMSAKPTPGYSWAFPDNIPEEAAARRTSSSDESNHYDVSRQNSLAASSVRSSIFSTESALPHGQRRFDDDVPTHHHTMQHRSVSQLQNEGGVSGGGNYSRTPELRISHKLAERKRRSEMKDLFEELNKAVPTNGGAKASKWEILTKAIEYIRSSQAQERNLHGEVQRLRGDSEYAREAHKEIDMLQTEIAVMHERLRRLDPSTPHIYGQYSSRLTAQASQANGQPHQFSLPSMNAAPPSQPQYGTPMAPPTGAMQGIEYGVRR